MADALPKVSMILPAYNCESTLARCIDSILEQAYPNIELIIISDGSTDGTDAICRDYAAAHAFIQYHRQENAGVSAARNAALALASGEFLQFIDADDWLAPNSTDLLVARAQETACDLVIANFYRVIGKRKSEKGNITETSVMSRSDYISWMMKEPSNFYYGVMWNKLYRRDIVTAHSLHCCEDMSWCEDFMFNLDYICFAERFAALQAPVYYYVKSPNSLVERESGLANTVRTKHITFEAYKALYEHMDLYNENKLEVMKFLVSYARDGGTHNKAGSGKKLQKEKVR